MSNDESSSLSYAKYRDKLNFIASPLICKRVADFTFAPRGYSDEAWAPLANNESSEFVEI